MTANRAIIDVLPQLDCSAISVQQTRCAKVRNRNVECLKCAESCTSGCISLVEDELVIDTAKCVGCGTCATVCPTCAIEARNPSDAELLGACSKALSQGEAVIACQQLLCATEGLVDKKKIASVVCAGRVDESLVVGLVANGAKTVHIACGNCAMCAQEHGLSTARMVASTANELLRAWGSGARVVVEQGSVTSSVLAEGVDSSSVEQTVGAYFAVERGNEPVRGREGVAATDADGADSEEDTCERSSVFRVMRDGTLPHFLPDRREALLNGLAEIGEPVVDDINTRLWGCVVIDGTKCSSCRMCATFCPTGAISKFDEDDEMGVIHFPGDCVKCGSCRDICPEGAILLLDEVKARFVVDGATHRYVMTPRPVKLDDPHQILNTMKQNLNCNLYER